MVDKKLISLTLAMVALGAASRLLPHPPNVTPIAAMALLGGTYLPAAYAWTLPLLILFVSDLFLGFHSTLPFVYGSFLLTAWIGLKIKNRKTWGNILTAAIASSILFFLVTNFGVWLTQNLYTKDLGGLAACYTAAVPFYRNTLLGDIFFTCLLFGLEEIQIRLFHLQTSPSSP